MKSVMVASFIGSVAAQSTETMPVDIDAELDQEIEGEMGGKYEEMGEEFDATFWEEQFIQMDTDADGVLSLEEALAVASSEEEKESIKHFMESADADESGSVDLPEYKAFAEHHEQNSFSERLQIIEDEFMSADTDGDGFVTTEEVAEIIGDGADHEDLMSFFEMADTDRDGKLSYDEYVEYAFNNNFEDEDFEQADEEEQEAEL